MYAHTPWCACPTPTQEGDKGTPEDLPPPTLGWRRREGEGREGEIPYPSSGIPAPTDKHVNGGMEGQAIHSTQMAMVVTNHLVR